MVSRSTDFRQVRRADSARAPSYFSQFFGQQLYENGSDAGGVRTLYIDRDPVTFQDISRHLQGMCGPRGPSERLMTRQATI